MTITDHDADDVLVRIRKLLAKAEDPAATAGEAETYTAKASELMARYGIDRALLAAADPSLDVVGDRVVVLDRPYAAEKGQLITEIALSLGCRVVRRTRYPDGTKEISVHLFGHRSDLQRTEILFTSLLLQAMRALARTPVPAWDHPAAFRRTWLVGTSSAHAPATCRARATPPAGGRASAPNLGTTGLTSARRALRR